MMQGNDCSQVANPNKKNLVGIATIEMLRLTYPSPKSFSTLSERNEIQGIASVISDAIGVGAKKNIAKWRINMLY